MEDLKKNYSVAIFADENGKVFGIDIVDTETKESLEIPGWDIEQYELDHTNVQEFVNESIKYFNLNKEEN